MLPDSSAAANSVFNCAAKLPFGRIRSCIKSRALLEHAPDVPFSVENGNDLKWCRFWPVNNGVVGIPVQCPETEWARREVGSGVAAQRTIGEKRASIIDRLFYAGGGVLASLGNVRPNIENIRSGERGVST
jgi:hypothetical protein